MALRTEFQKLNSDWNAEAGAPEPTIKTDSSGLILSFYLNSALNPKFRDYDRGEIFFPHCWRYRLGGPNDEGWDMGQCRFRCWAQDWGNFYEVKGELLDGAVSDWVAIRTPPQSESSRHFLFYFKDDTFECDAESWSFNVLPVSDAEFERLRASRISVGPTTTMTAIRNLALEPVHAVQRQLRRWNARKANPSA